MLGYWNAISGRAKNYPMYILGCSFGFSNDYFILENYRPFNIKKYANLISDLKFYSFLLSGTFCLLG